MELNILERDITKGTAKLEFIHNGVNFTTTYDLGLVIPGTRKALEEYNQEFTEEMQNEVIEKLKVQIQREIEAGIIQNPI